MQEIGQNHQSNLWPHRCLKMSTSVYGRHLPLLSVAWKSTAFLYLGRFQTYPIDTALAWVTFELALFARGDQSPHLTGCMLQLMS